MKKVRKETKTKAKDQSPKSYETFSRNSFSANCRAGCVCSRRYRRLDHRGQSDSDLQALNWQRIFMARRDWLYAVQCHAFDFHRVGRSGGFSLWALEYRRGR